MCHFRNREIGFVLSPFSFHLVRASGRGEAAWARGGCHSARWGFRVLVSTCSTAVFSQILVKNSSVLAKFACSLKVRTLKHSQKAVGFMHLCSPTLAKIEGFMRLLAQNLVFYECLSTGPHKTLGFSYGKTTSNFPKATFPCEKPWVLCAPVLKHS